MRAGWDGGGRGRVLLSDGVAGARYSRVFPPTNGQMLIVTTHATSFCAAAAEPRFTITVRTQDGVCFPLKVDRNHTIETVKKNIAIEAMAVFSGAKQVCLDFVLFLYFFCFLLFSLELLLLFCIHTPCSTHSCMVL